MEVDKNDNLVLKVESAPLDADFTQKLLTGMSSFFNGLSTTTSRIEDRSVVTTVDAATIFDNPQLSWKPRNKKDSQQDFTTITSYSNKIILKSPQPETLSVKLRTRKYFVHAKGETDTSKMESLFGNVGSIELKVANISYVSSDSYETYKGSIFKPRIFISDELLEKISSMTLEELTKPETKAALADKLCDLKYDSATMVSPSAIKQNGKPMNPCTDRVDDFINAIVLLLQENKSLFDIQMVIAYNREAYSAALENGTEYQYTIDKNIRIFKPILNLSPSHIQSYLDEEPIHKVEEGAAFTELKSPLAEKDAYTKTYQELSKKLLSKHNYGFKLGKGKYSLGKTKRSLVPQKTLLSKQLQTEGLYYYLIKGVGNLPSQPNRKQLVEQGKWKIALPLEIDEEIHRLVLGYRSNILNGKISQALTSLALVDSMGEEVPLNKDSVTILIQDARKNPDPSTITIGENALTFPSIIDHATVIKFTRFFDKFYTNHSKGQANPREINSLYAVKNSKDLAQYTRKMKTHNALSFLKDRTFKYAATAAIFAALALGNPNIMKKLRPAEDTNPPPTQEVSVKVDGKNVNLKVTLQKDGTFRVISDKTKEHH